MFVCKFLKHVKSKLYHIETSKTKGLVIFGLTALRDSIFSLYQAVSNREEEKLEK